MGSYDDTLQQSLEGDLLRMMGDPCFSDMLFLCGPTQEELPASKLLVAARSPVLESMLLKAGMAETKLSRILLPAIDLSTMRICLEFLYTNTVQQSSWVEGFEAPMMVIAAAKFFLVKKLEQIALSHLDSIIPAYQKWGTCYLVDVIKAYSYGVKLHLSHLDMHLHSVLHRLMIGCIDNRSCWKLECYKHLSEQALVHLLQNLDAYLEDENFPVIEYVRFLLVIYWSSSRLPLLSDGSPQVQKRLEDTLEDYLPWNTNVELLDLLNAPQMSSLDANAVEFMKLLAEQLSGYLQRFPVNISMIPLSVLRDVIEPLKIIPRPMLMTAYRQQAQSKADVRWDEFLHSKNYTIERGDATVISCNSDILQGFASCKMFADTFRIVSFHWEVVILTPCEKFRIGLCWGEELIRSESYSNDPLWDHEHYILALNSDGTLLERGITRQYCDAFQGQKGVIIGVHFYTFACSFSINGKVMDVASYMQWLSDEKLFLTVSMQKPGRVQIKTGTDDWGLWRKKFKRTGKHSEL